MQDRRNILAAVSYITWIGFLIALIAAERDDRFIAHHLNQALILNIISVVGNVLRVIPFLGSLASNLISLGVLVLWIMGASRAFRGSMRPLPFIGNIHLIG